MEDRSSPYEVDMPERIRRAGRRLTFAELYPSNRPVTLPVPEGSHYTQMPVLEPNRFPLFTRVTRTSSTEYTADVRLAYGLTVLSAVVWYSRGIGWEFGVLCLVGACAIWKTLGQREGREFRRVRKALGG